MELDGLVGWMVGQLDGWLVGWLVGWFAHWLHGWFFLSLISQCVNLLAGCWVYGWLFRLVGLLEDTRSAQYVSMILSLLDILLHVYCCNDEIRGQSNVPAALPLGQRYHGTQSISECYYSFVFESVVHSTSKNTQAYTRTLFKYNPIQTTRHAATSPRLAYIQCEQNNSDFSEDIVTP